MANVLDVETTGHLRVLRLNRPDRKNALNGELIQAIVTSVREAATDDDVWAIAMTGNGDAFCSGLDLTGIGGGGEDERHAPRDEPSTRSGRATTSRSSCGSSARSPS